MRAAAGRRKLLGRLLDGVALVVAPILAKLDFRFFHLDGARIGDCAAGLGSFVQFTELGLASRHRPVFVPIPTRRVANRSYIDYWRKYVRIPLHPLLYPLAFRLEQRPELRLPFTDGAHERLTLTQQQWEAEGRPPLLSLEPEHERRGRDALASLGMERDSWFVALHVRESGYLGEPPDSYRRQRNADVMTYLPAAQGIVDRGGWVIRVGDPSMKPLPELEHVVDYVHSPLHSDWMDVFLAASCRYFLGTASGLFVVAWSFGRPCALANWESLVIRPWASRDIFIPKLWRLDVEDRFLTFPELTRPPFVDPLRRIRPSDHQLLGLSLVDNTPEEIEDLVEEMFAREAGAALSDEEERLHASFEEIVAEHYPDGAAARVGTRFLARHRDLLTGVPGVALLRPD